MDSDGKPEPGLPRASVSDIETGINSSPTRNYGTDRSLSSSTVRLARLRMIEQSAPWKTPVSDLLKFYKRDDEIRAVKSPVLQRFYREQNEILDWMVERYMMDEAGQTETTRADTVDHTMLSRAAINASFGLNVCLAGLKVVALVISGSVAMLASMIDSFLDLLSGAVLFVTRRAIDHTDIYQYPQGKRRLEPVGVLVFATVMAVSALQIVREAIGRLVDGLTGTPHAIDVDVIVLSVACVTVGSKLCMFILCSIIGSKTGSSAVKAYASDHGNDVLSNLVGIGGMLAAAKVPSVWYLDPIAAIAISVFIMVTWIGTGLLHVDHVVGRGAGGLFLKKLCFLAMNHHQKVVAVDTTRAYHFGEEFLVEIDIVLPPTMSLGEAHDIGESLQVKIEGLEEVERAFVHLDTEFQHRPEHKRSS